MTNTTEQVKAREGVNIEDTCGDNLWSIQEIQKKVRDKDLCYKRVSLTLWDLTGSPLTPKVAAKTRMQESDN